MRNFISIASEVIGGRFAYIGTNCGRALRDDEADITSRTALDFLYALHGLAKRKGWRGASFVWYAASLDVELIVKDLPPAAKDVLFPSPENAERLKDLRKQLERIAASIKREKNNERRRVLLRVRSKRVRASIAGLQYAYAYGYRLQVRQGKMLSIYKEGKDGRARNGLTIYDIEAFFRKPLREVALKHLGDCPPELQRSRGEMLPLWNVGERDAIINYNKAVTKIIERLAVKLDEYLTGAGIHLTKWYGASAAASHLLHRWNVRADYRPLVLDNSPVIKCNISKSLLEAINSAFYGGRMEALKLGTFQDVYIYDINAAYAYAASLLGKTDKRWRFVRGYNIYEPLSVWFIEYDLPDDCYIGMLPHRRASGSVVYRKRGRGWYYQPEVREVMRRFPDCVKVHHGFTCPYTPVSFGDELRRLYSHRVELQQQGNAGEKIFKLLLASIYGKFAQRVGVARYHNRIWAGWITSFVRAMLLEACEGQERDVICFAQDAIHSRKPLVKPQVSDLFGAWKLSEQQEGLYIFTGIYRHKGQKNKTATRGFESIDFDAAVADLNKGFYMKAAREFFVGWRIARSMPVLYGDKYLERVREEFTIEPKVMRHRQLAPATIDTLAQGFDWTKDFYDTEIIKRGDNKTSASYVERDYTRALDMMVDVIRANRD